MILEKWALPFSQQTGLQMAHTEPIPRSQIDDDCCQICWNPQSLEHTYQEQNWEDMPQCDTCGRTYHWKCLIDHRLCTYNHRIQTEQSNSWDCPACANISITEKSSTWLSAERCSESLGILHGNRKNYCWLTLTFTRTCRILIRCTQCLYTLQPQMHI